MNADLMRKIDFWVGVPACLLFTLLLRLLKIVRPRSAAMEPPRRILFLELAEIGGLVVAHPALDLARRLHPEAEIYFLTFAGGQDILDLMGAVAQDRQIVIRPHGPLTFLKDTLAAVRRMRALGIDSTVNLETFARFGTILAWLSGAPRRVGFFRFHDEGRFLGDLITHKVVYNPHLHAARTFLTLVQALGEEPDSEPRAKVNMDDIPLRPPRVESVPIARRAMQGTLRGLYPDLRPDQRLVLLNPNASDLVAVRRWPRENFLALARGLLRDPDLLVVLTGLASERAAAESLRRDLDSPRVLNLAGGTNLAQLIDLYNISHLLVTNDSGPAHFASLTQMPVLVLFGPETPAIYGPLGSQTHVVYKGLACSPCVSAYNQKRSPCADNRCLKLITPEEVLALARRILEGKAG